MATEHCLLAAGEQLRMQTDDLGADDVEMDNNSADAVDTQQSWFASC